MNIERIAIERFGRLRAFEAELAPGLNVIKGPNEAGKSTLRTALAHALFTNPKTRAADVKDRASWGSDELFRLGVTISTSHGETLELTKDFQAKTARLELIGEGRAERDAVLTDPAKVDRVLLTELGLRSQRLYESTACIPQEQVADIESGRAEIAELLQQQVSGGADAVSAEQVLKRLDERLRGLRRGVSAAHKNPGPIKQSRDEVEKLTTQVAEARSHLGAWEHAEEVLRTAATEHKRLGQDMETKRALLAKVRARQELEKQLEEAKRRRDELDERLAGVERLQSQLAEAEGQEGGSARLREQGPRALEQAVRIERQIGELEQQSQVAGATAHALRHVPDPGMGATWVLRGSIAVGAVLTLVGCLAAMSDPSLLWMAVPGLVLISGSGAVLLSQRYARHRAERELRARRQEYEATAHDAREQIGELREEARTLLQGVGCKTTEELQARLATATTAASSADQIREALKGLLGGRTREELEQEYAEVRRARRDLEDRLDDMAGPELEPLEYQKLELDVEKGEAELEWLAGEMRQSELTLAGIRVDREEVAGLQERLAVARERLQRREREAAACELALAVLHEAHRATLKRAAEVLSPRLGELLGALTLGRYDQVTVDEGTLEISVWSDDKRGAIAVQPERAAQIRRAGELSAGTLGQVFLAARLALVDLIWPDERPPLVLDDPLVAFDPERRRAAVRMLQDYAHDGQVLLFTCSGEYDRFADKVVEMK